MVRSNVYIVFYLSMGSYIYHLTHHILFIFAWFFTADETSSAGANRRAPGSSPKTSPEEPKTDGQGTSLRRACSLSDLNKPNVPRRILPAPPANGMMNKPEKELTL